MDKKCSRREHVKSVPMTTGSLNNFSEVLVILASPEM